MREQSTSDGALTSLVETFETPGGTDNPYDKTVFSTNSLDPNFTSPDLPTSWGTKSALVTIGPDQGAAFWMTRDGAESPSGYEFSGSFMVETDGMSGTGSGGLADAIGGTPITLFISKPADWSGPLAAWRLYMTEENGQLELALVLGLDTNTNNSSGAVYKVPINIHQAYDVSVNYDTAHRYYSWSLDGQLEGAGDMPSDWPLIGTEIIGSSGSSTGRNSSYAVDNVGWVAVTASDRNFAETFESPNGTDNHYEAEPGDLNGTDKRYDEPIAPGNSFDPNFHSPDLPASWGTKSGLITIGSGSIGGALLRETDQVPSPNGYNFTGSFLVAVDGLQEGQAVTLFAGKAKDPDMIGTSFGWRLHLYKSQGELQLLLAVGADSSVNNPSAATYQLPIIMNRPYDVDILYDTARRVYAWTLDGNTIASSKMPDDYPLIGTKVIGSSWSSSGRNTTYAVDNASWTELSADPPCYCRGTLILTTQGEMPVEALAIGDRVVTHSGAARAIRWIGRRSYSGRFAFAQEQILPVCIKAGALDEGVPRRDLWVSPDHALYLEEVLIEARDLVNGVSIYQAREVETIAYFHIELDIHDVIIAEGAYAESFIDDDNRGLFENAQEYRVLYPDAAGRSARYCAPRCAEGREVERARRRIAERAGLPLSVEALAIGQLCGIIDEIEPERISGWAQDSVQPELPVCLEILADRRVIGYALANHYRADLEAAGLGSGRHAFEFTPEMGLVLAPDLTAVRRALDGAALPYSTQRCDKPGRLGRAAAGFCRAG